MQTSDKLSGSVLFVDDEDGIRQSLGRWIARHVDTVWLAPDGEVGLQLYLEHHPDVVVTDIAMPVMDGLAMTRAIKAHDPHAQVVVSTAYSSTQHFLECIEIGVDGYVLKPIEPPQLLAAMGKCLRIVANTRELERRGEERDRLLRELQESATKVKTLSGLLPICASCKKIRDDAGYWKQLETYITEHSGVLFSHGFCPSCVRTLYPEFANRAVPGDAASKAGSSGAK